MYCAFFVTGCLFDHERALSLRIKDDTLVGNGGTDGVRIWEG